MSDWHKTYHLSCPYPMCDAAIRVKGTEGQRIEGRCICAACVVRVVWPDEASDENITFTEPVLRLVDDEAQP